MKKMKIGKSPCWRRWFEKSQVSYLISSSSLFSKNFSFVLLYASSWELVRVLIVLDCEVELRDFFRWWMIEMSWRFGKVMNVERLWPLVINEWECDWASELSWIKKWNVIEELQGWRWFRVLWKMIESSGVWEVMTNDLGMIKMIEKSFV